MVLVVKNPPANVGDLRDAGSVPGLGSSPGEGHGSPLQYSCLENPMDRGAWWPSSTRLQRLDVTEATWHTHASSLGPLQAGGRAACRTTAYGGTQSSGYSSYLQLSPRGILLDAPSPYSLGS